MHRCKLVIQASFVLNAMPSEDTFVDRAAHSESHILHACSRGIPQRSDVVGPVAVMFFLRSVL